MTPSVIIADGQRWLAKRLSRPPGSR